MIFRSPDDPISRSPDSPCLRGRFCRKKRAAFLPPSLWREGLEGDLLTRSHLLGMFLHMLKPSLLVFLQQLLRLGALVGSEHGIDLRFRTLLFHDQVAHDLGLFAGEGASL